MIKDYKIFSLHIFWEYYLNKEEINDFHKLYKIGQISVKEFENLEDEFYNYFINLNENEIIIFLEWIKNLIINKEYINNHDKSYFVYNVICNWLFWFIHDDKDKFKISEVIKEYYRWIWNFIIKLSNNDSYLIENWDRYLKKIEEL